MKDKLGYGLLPLEFLSEGPKCSLKTMEDNSDHLEAQEGVVTDFSRARILPQECRDDLFLPVYPITSVGG